MAKRLLPTTKTQVSGHRFMRRRVEHGLIFGDVRMIHDPLGSRRRAVIFGLVAVLMISGIMGLFAWMRPNPDPGDAPILRASDGTLYVRVGDAVHPVTNLTSARLITGSPAEPVRVGDEHLTAIARGVPVGIVNAPAMFAPDSATAGAGANSEDAWSVCATEDMTIVRAGTAPTPLAAGEAVLAEANESEWVIDAHGRTKLPPPTTPEGRIIRRAIGIDSSTPRWKPAAQVVAAVKELPPYTMPAPLPEVLRTDEGVWVRTDADTVHAVTEVEAQILLDSGAPTRDIGRAELAEYADADPADGPNLPDTAAKWMNPSDLAVCASADGGGATMTQSAATEGAVELSGESVATHFAGLTAGSVAVDSGHGYHVVAGNGLRNPVPDEHTLEVIGAKRIEPVRWEILSLLPEGEPLERERALTATY